MRTHAGFTSGVATCPSFSLSRMAPAPTNEMHATKAEGPIGFGIEGALACVYKNSCQQ